MDLPRSLSENAAVAAEFDVVPIIPEGGGALVCGSPYEVANVPTNYGAHYGSGFDLATDYSKCGASSSGRKMEHILHMFMRRHDWVRRS